MKQLFTSKKLIIILWIVGGLILLLVAFGLGMAVGTRRADFYSRFGENYERNFSLARGFNAHGVAGEVIDTSTSTISVKDFNGSEESVSILPDTIVSKGDQIVSSTAIMAGNGVIVIGHPDDEGQIEARFIRLFPSSSSLPAFPAPQAPAIPTRSPGTGY